MDVPLDHDSDFTANMYFEHGNHIGFVHNLTNWDPSAQLEPVECDALEHFLQLPLMRLGYLYSLIFCLLLSISVYVIFFCVPLLISVYY